jgi:hypothetical protein
LYRDLYITNSDIQIQYQQEKTPKFARCQDFQKARMESIFGFTDV